MLADLHRRPGWLVIFDNAEDPGTLRDWLPNGPGHVLITSRSAAWTELAVPVPVDVLPRTESVALLQGPVPHLPTTDAAMLAAALGDLPLAIAQAAAYLAETRMPAADYAALLRDRAFDLLNEGKPATYQGGTLTAVTALAYYQLCHTDKAAADLAAICGHLGPHPIPIDWLTSGFKALPRRLRVRLTDPVARSRLLATLTRTSLVGLSDDGLTMHRLTQAILYDLAPGHTSIRALARAAAYAAVEEAELARAPWFGPNRTS